MRRRKDAHRRSLWNSVLIPDKACDAGWKSAFEPGEDCIVTWGRAPGLRRTHQAARFRSAQRRFCASEIRRRAAALRRRLGLLIACTLL